MIRPLNLQWKWILVAVTSLLLLTLIFAPRSNHQTSGSTYGRSPDGYGAWYEYMAGQGTPVQRWQKPEAEFFTQKTADKRTLLQIQTQPRPFPEITSNLGVSEAARDWIAQGNTMVLLGFNAPVAEAPFSTNLVSDQGAVKIETSRRWNGPITPRILGDRHGGVVWQESLGKGRIIVAVTPFIGANAYQNEPGNFPLLADVVTRSGNNVWVDEYIHGYKDADVMGKEGVGNLGEYFSKTVFVPLGVQAAILVLLLIWAQNRRFGAPIRLSKPTPDNSTAYIQALAGVLQKAQRHEFVLDLVGREEQLQLQRSLGLGTKLLEREPFIQALAARTGQTKADLVKIFPRTWDQNLREKDLLTWLILLRQIRQNR